MPKLAFLFRQLSLFDGPGEGGIRSEDSSPGFQTLCIGPFAHVQVIVKPRMWETWRVFWTRRTGTLRVEIPALLETAPEEIKLVLLDWALLVSRRGMKRNPGLKAERARLETAIRAYLHGPPSDPASSPVQARMLARNRRRLARLVPQGRHHDLSASFDRINAGYFQSRLEAKVTWSARLGGLSTHTMAQDGEGRGYHLITISRGYDSPEVKPEILDGVMYHECLHAAIPPEIRNGRRIVHGPEFRRRERAYAHFDIWRKWHRDGLPQALRRLRRSGR